MFCTIFNFYHVKMYFSITSATMWHKFTLTLHQLGNKQIQHEKE